MLNDNSPTKLIIEIKSHSSSKRNYAAADSTLLLVQRMGLEDKVEYISFSMDVCKELVKMDPSARVAYLSGGLSPQELYQDGITGIDYKMANYRDNPEWINEAHNLCMYTNVWTVNNMNYIIEMNNLGIDYITTDYPEKAMEIQNYYLKVWTDFEEATTPIKEIKDGMNTNIKIYSLSGVHQNSIKRGTINIVESNGKIRKLYKK